ncbi:MAG: DPP IV N-terminal domain-containing protein, partial [Terriglobales bacterium]
MHRSGFVLDVALSPDGKQFLYVGQVEIYLQNLAGGDPRQLTNDGFRK